MAVARPEGVDGCGAPAKDFTPREGPHAKRGFRARNGFAPRGVSPQGQEAFRLKAKRRFASST